MGISRTLTGTGAAIGLDVAQQRPDTVVALSLEVGQRRQRRIAQAPAPPDHSQSHLKQADIAPDSVSDKAHYVRCTASILIGKSDFATGTVSLPTGDIGPSEVMDTASILIGKSDCATGTVSLPTGDIGKRELTPDTGMAHECDTGISAATGTRSENESGRSPAQSRVRSQIPPSAEDTTPRKVELELVPVVAPLPPRRQETVAAAFLQGNWPSIAEGQPYHASAQHPDLSRRRFLLNLNWEPPECEVCPPPESRRNRSVAGRDRDGRVLHRRNHPGTLATIEY